MTRSSHPLTIEALLETPDPPHLGPDPRPGTLPLSKLKADSQALLTRTQLDPTHKELIGACLLLWHDHLDAAHRIAQEITTRDGSYLHGIMHRREPDYDNAKYWFHRVGSHPCFTLLEQSVPACLARVGQQTLREQLLPRGQWDLLAFVDLCDANATSQEAGPTQARTALRELQALELRTLLAYWLG